MKKEMNAPFLEFSSKVNDSKLLTPFFELIISSNLSPHCLLKFIIEQTWEAIFKRERERERSRERLREHRRSTN